MREISSRFMRSIQSKLKQNEPVDRVAKETAAVAVVLKAKSGMRDEFLLIRRAERNGDPWSGQVAFPGGRVEPDDQSFAATATRETSEEVGIQLTGHELLGSLPIVTTRSQRLRVLPFVFRLKSTVRIQVNEEVAETFWIPLSDLEGLEAESREVRIDQGSLSADSYVVAGHVIWGLTFRIINLLLDREAQSKL